MKKYSIINNAMGWLVFAVATITYMLTIEPTASFWDCPEFIAQGYKLEIGHPPGNPMFILAARFAANFAGGDVMAVAKCVNAMSAILSAATILLLFWTITHLVKKLVVKGDDSKMSLAQYLVVMGSGVCGALAYAWSDTFWFSAVEAEVYAFSSFCTALVFWLILKWENRADDPSSDRYLILIAFVFGISLGVHLLNLLAIPAIALIFYYRKTKNSTVKGSLLTLLVSFAVIVLILYGLEPGFVELAGYFELLFVNTFHMGYNSGVLFYAILLMAVFSWALFELYRNKSNTLKRISLLLSFFLSGMFFIGDGTMGIIIPILLTIGAAIYLFRAKHISSRIFSNVILSMMMIFIGFSSYALVLIRSGANLPLDENSPNSPFALTSYLSRDQYGKSPLIYGNTYSSPVVRYSNGKVQTSKGEHKYTRVVKTNANESNQYVDLGPQESPVYAPETNMLFPRIHSSSHAEDYASLLGTNVVGQPVEATEFIDESGNVLRTTNVNKPTFAENLEFFFSYQLHHMYWRYFMWNFAGRQNDIASNGPGDVARGNWISGIPFIDNSRLPNLEFVPDEFGKENKGNNVFFMLPLLLGLIGLLWQAFSGKKGIEQFWVVFFLFFMTGIAIVMYLNQTPNQPRERDYAYAGSFYAYAIWIGMGVAALWKGAMALLNKKEKDTDKETQTAGGYGAIGTVCAAVCAIVGILVPLQMVSQTWDDHDRSGRYCARDFGENYLQSLDKDAIVFCNGDNDTFPLWYLQEVEGVRTDVRAVNLSYLSTDWYIAQMQRAAYDSKPLPMMAGPLTYAYDKRMMGYLSEESSEMPISAEELFKNFYNDETYKNNRYNEPMFSSMNVYIPTNVDAAIKAGVIGEDKRNMADDRIDIDIYNASGGGLSASQTMTLDLVATSIAQGWKRPVYFASTVPDQLYMGLRPYLMSTGLCYQVTPIKCNDQDSEIECNTDKMYEIVTKKYKWGGLDKAKPGSLYLDETVMRMVTTMRNSMMSLSASFYIEGIKAQDSIASIKTSGADTTALATYVADRFKKAEHVLDLMQEKMPVETAPYQHTTALQLADCYSRIYLYGNSETAKQKAVKVLEDQAKRYAQYIIFYESCEQDDVDAGNFSRYDMFMVRSASQLFSIYRLVNPENFDNFVKKFSAIEKGGCRVSPNMMKMLTMSDEEREKLAYEQQIQAAREAQMAADAQMAEEAQMGGMSQADGILPKQEGMEDSL